MAKKNFKYLLLFFVALLSSQFNQVALSQKVIKKMSHEICDCLDKISFESDAATIERLSSDCVTTSMLKHQEIFSKYDKDEFLDKLIKQLFKSCDKFSKMLNVIKSEKTSE